jgi:hypothetical protein
MIGLSTITMAECPSCGSASSLELEEHKKINESRANWSEKRTCQSCAKEFRIIEFIIQGLISENVFSEWSFVSDIQLAGTEDISVGKTHLVELKQDVPAINKIFLTCKNSHADVYPIYNSGKFFKIISSEATSGTPIGEKQTVSWILFGKSEKHSIEIWQNLLVSAKEEIIKKQYTLSLLSCAIAFENFIDSLLGHFLKSRGIPSEASDKIMETIPNIYVKVHKLLDYLDNIRFKDFKEINKKWQTVVEKRNRIAHGANIFISMDEAKQSFETIVRGIFYILERTSTIQN